MDIISRDSEQLHPITIPRENLRPPSSFRSLPPSSILFESIRFRAPFSLPLPLFLNSLWRKLLICFIANGGCPGET